MFSRTTVSLAKVVHSPFARFLKKVGPSLTRTKGPRRMAVAGALWTVTKPKFNTVDSPARAKAAISLYNKKGHLVLSDARALKAKQAKKTKTAKKIKVRGRPAKSKKTSSTKRRSIRKSKAAPKRKAARKVKASSSSASKQKKPSSVATFAAYKRAVTAGRLTKAEETILRTAYDATPGLTANRRIAGGKRLLTNLRNITGTKTAITARTGPKKKPSTRRLKAKLRSRRATSKTSKTRKASKSKRAAKKTKKPKKATAAKRSTGSKKVKRVKKAKVSKKSTKSAASKKAKKPAKKKAVAKKSAKKKSTAVKRSAAAGRRNPYLRFYRAMVLTGEIPNHPTGARSRRIKKLWANTRHLKTVDSRIKLGTAYAKGVIPLPSGPKMVAVKPAPKAAKKRVKKAARTAHAAHAVSYVAPKTAAAIAFTVPDFYDESPFTAAYVALHNFAAGSTPSAKMRNVSQAWAESALPAGVADARTPHQRIQAAADVLKRA